MRPDEHRKKKNEAYKKKHNLNPSTVTKPDAHTQTERRKARDKAGSSLGSNYERYTDSETQQYQPVGKNLQEFLASGSTTAAVFPSSAIDEDGFSQIAGDTLSLDISSIEKAVCCFDLMQIIGLQSNLMKDEVNGGSQQRLTDYVNDQMDPVYTVDHLPGNVLVSGAEILYNNTGQRKPDTGTCSAGDNVTDPLRMAVDSVTEAGEELELLNDDLQNKQSELEDWLDSVLDD